jgi:uncharacterized protein YbjT (DUF2867 family)
MKIAVIGATGMLGIPVVVELVNAGFEVTALVRNPERAKRILPAQTIIAEADVTDIESLKRGLVGQDAVYLSLSVAPTEKKDDFHAEAEGLDNILTAARFCGVRRVAYLSAMIQDGDAKGWWVIDVWRKAIAKIKSSGIPFTIFYPTNFMETLEQRHGAGRFLALFGTARYPNYWIAGRDFGRQVAASFQLDEAASREFVIQGPEALTYEEAGRRFAKNSRSRLYILTIPLPLIKALGRFSQSMDFNYRIMDAVLSYPEVFKAEEAWKALGKPSTTIEEFARSRVRATWPRSEPVASSITNSN